MQISKEYVTTLTCMFCTFSTISRQNLQAFVTPLSSIRPNLRKLVIDSQKWSSFFGPPFNYG